MFGRTASRLSAVPALVVALAMSGFLAGCSDPGRTPKGAAKAWAKALESGDKEAARAVATGSEEQMKMLDGMVVVGGAAKKLQDAAIDKWGDAAKKDLGGGMPGQNVTLDLAEAIDGAEEKVEGDTATIKIKTAGKTGGGMEELKLKKVDGKWKMDLGAMLGDMSGGPGGEAGMKMASAMFDKMKTAIDEVTAGIKDDKYKNVEEVQSAMMEKMMAAAFSGLGDLAEEGEKKE